jgi:hypothetical protein
MIRKLIIDPIVPKGSISLVGEYRDKKTRKHLFLVDEGKRVVTDYEIDDYKMHNLTIFEGQPISIEYDDESLSEVAIIDFFKNHPFCLTEGHDNPNFTRAIFKVHLEHEKVEFEVEKLEKNLEITLKVLSMSFEDKYNLAFALGLNPKGMTHSELVVRLIGSNLTGVAITERKTFDIFYNSLESNKKAFVYANKAISLNIINLQEGYYKVGGRTIGTSPKDVIDLCLSDKEFFNGYIVPEVNRLDTGLDSSKDDYKVEGLIADTIEERSEELAADPSMLPVDKKPRGRRPKEEN